MDEESINYLKKIVEEKNPNLIIITDDVYGTFADIKLNNITLTIENNQSNLKVDSKDLILNNEEDIYYSYNLYKDKDIIAAARYGFLIIKIQL